MARRAGGAVPGRSGPGTSGADLAPPSGRETSDRTGRHAAGSGHAATTGKAGRRDQGSAGDPASRRGRDAAPGRAARRAPPPTARAAARLLLDAVLAQGRPLDAAMDETPAYLRLEARDRAFAHLLAASCLRRLGTLDAVLARCLDRPVSAKAAPVRQVLRLGAAQLLLLGTPPHAAVATAVEEVRALGLDGFAGLVNAVLRRIDRERAALLAGLDAPERDTPGWLWARWVARFGETEARAIAAAHQAEAPLDLTLADPVQGPDWAAKLDATLLPTGSLRLPAGARVAELPGFAEGAFWVQDAAAALPARLLRDVRGLNVIDLCAAPGGKTAQLAAAGASVTAVERAPERAERLRENLARLRLADRVRVVEADALAWRPEAPADAVLLDAPCTATGTIRRHPDLPHLKRAEDVASLTAVQAGLVAAAAAMLRPGGRLVYAVCSLEAEEGPGQAAAALGAGLGLALDPIRSDELPGLAEALTPEGWLLTRPSLWPALGGMDGFFAARFRR
ncbi:MAG: rRNA cytosine-C5-methylase [Alphaproteobacteria bacterium]|nr:rRNA cytosine-C5-methylase [Alphaproteobacteria bacterium]